MRFTLEYLGTAYAGFQRQPGKETVQTVLERAIESVTGEATPVLASGRTDAGAHALGQVVAFDTSSSLGAEALLHGTNAHLPADIRVISAAEASRDFNPRHAATSRRYRYIIWNRPEPSPFWLGRAFHVRRRLDTAAMDRAIKLLCGTRDLGAFVPLAHDGSRVRTVFVARCDRDGDLITIEIEATGFMKQMVRSIVGTLVLAGCGKLDLEGFRAIVQSGDRGEGGETVPACGLYLVGVSYDGSLVDGPPWQAPGVTSAGGQPDKETA